MRLREVKTHTKLRAAGNACQARFSGIKRKRGGDPVRAAVGSPSYVIREKLKGGR